MAAITKITITHGDENAQSVANQVALDTTARKEAIQGLINLLQGLLGGTRSGRIELGVENATAGNKASATNTIAQASLVADTDTLVIGVVTLTWVASSANENQITIGGSDAACATNCAAIINAHSALAGVVTATASGAVVTITADYPGIWGEQIYLAETGDGQTLSGAALAGVTSTVTADTRSYNFGVA